MYRNQYCLYWKRRIISHPFYSQWKIWAFNSSFHIHRFLYLYFICLFFFWGWRELNIGVCGLGCQRINYSICCVLQPLKGLVLLSNWFHLQLWLMKVITLLCYHPHKLTVNKHYLIFLLWFFFYCIGIKSQSIVLYCTKTHMLFLNL